MRLSSCFTAVTLAFVAVCSASAQQSDSEFAVTVGTLSGSNPNAPSGGLTLGSSAIFGANYARQFSHTHSWAALYWEVNALASPFRHLSGVPSIATSDIRSFYVTPGVRMQFASQERITPWIDGGAGYAFYDSSATDIAGVAAGNSRYTNTYAVEFGGGVDIVANKRYIIRGAAQGFYTGHPDYGVPATGGQFNFVISGGLVWRFGQ